MLSLPLAREGAMLDILDRKILKLIDGYRPTAAIGEIIRPFLSDKSDRALRERVKHLEDEGFVKLEKHPSCVLVKVTKKGHA